MYSQAEYVAMQEALHTLAGFSILGLIALFLAIGYRQTANTHQAYKQAQESASTKKEQVNFNVAQKLSIVMFLLFVIVMVGFALSVGAQL